MYRLQRVLPRKIERTIELAERQSMFCAKDIPLGRSATAASATPLIAPSVDASFEHRRPDTDIASHDQAGVAGGIGIGAGIGGADHDAAVDRENCIGANGLHSEAKLATCPEEIGPAGQYVAVVVVNRRPTLTRPRSDPKYLVLRKNRSFFKDLIGVQSRPPSISSKEFACQRVAAV